MDNDNRAIWLKPEEFASGYNLYGFKPAPGPIVGTVFCSARSAGSLSVYVKFAAPLTAAVDAIIFAETPAVLNGYWTVFCPTRFERLVCFQLTAYHFTAIHLREF